MNVVRWDAIVRHAHFAPAMPEGRGGGSDDNSSEASGSAVGYGRDKVEIQDTWEFQSHPENLFARESFRDVALDDGSGKTVERALDALPEPSTHAAAVDSKSTVSLRRRFFFTVVSSSPTRLRTF